MATFAFKAVDLAGIPQSGEIDGADKQSATSELKAKGLKVMALEEKKSGLQMELRLTPKRVKAGELTVMSRQLATMISSGMTLLRAFYVLEEQCENPLLRETVSAVRGFRKWKSSSWGRPQWDQFRLRIPFKIGDTVQKIALARWSRTFSALYGAGVPIMQAIEVTGQTAGNAVVDRAMEAVIASVKSGGSIAAPLKDAPIFPPMVAQMIAIGEETGNLDTMLSKVADFYEDQVAAAIKALTSILEPVMIVLVGGIVGFIVVAMYMPMFKVYDAIK